MVEEIQRICNLCQSDLTVRCCGLSIARDGDVVARKVYRSDGVEGEKTGEPDVDRMIEEGGMSVYEYEAPCRMRLNDAGKINFHFRYSSRYLECVAGLSESLPFVNISSLSNWVDTLRSFCNIRCASWGLERSDVIDEATFYCFPIKQASDGMFRGCMQNSLAQECLESLGCLVPRYSNRESCDVRIFSMSITSVGCVRRKVYSLYDATAVLMCWTKETTDCFARSCARLGVFPILMAMPVDGEPDFATVYFKMERKDAGR